MKKVLLLLATLYESPKKMELLLEYMEKLAKMAEEVDGFSEPEHTEMRLGNRVTAVKLLRGRRGLGLKEAIEMVDPYMKARGWYPMPGLKVIMYSSSDRHGDLTVECKNWVAVRNALSEWFYTDRPELDASDRRPMKYSSWKVYVHCKDVSEEYKEWFRSNL